MAASTSKLSCAGSILVRIYQHALACSSTNTGLSHELNLNVAQHMITPFPEVFTNRKSQLSIFLKPVVASES
eukprot:5551489-Amphidinium_carterae.2